jgi:nicotinamide-nucleotide amidase
LTEPFRHSRDNLLTKESDSMKAEIICIGTELLLGQIVDTNAAYLARELAGLGIELYHKSTVGDNLPRVDAVLRDAWARADLLIVSGGLGPTQDDLTREAVAGLLGETLKCNEAALEGISAFFAKMDRPMADSNRRQAMFPPSGRIIPNPVGTAPGLMAEKAGHIVAALPGVPRELTAMWEASLKPYLKERLARENPVVLTSQTVRMVGIGESAMEDKILDLIRDQINPTIGTYANRCDVSLRLTAKGNSEVENQRLIAELLQKIRKRLGEYIYGYDADNLESVIGKLLNTRKWRLALAESCTGGLISSRITDVPGSSGYYLGGINCYSNQLKQQLLSVPEQTLAEHGAVSEATARAMAAGVKRLTGAEVGLGVTGIAGPGGATASKPVGLVYFAVDLPGDVQVVEQRVFPYNRIHNKEAAAQWGLTMLWQSLTAREVC